MRVTSVGMGRVWVCMLLCFSQIHYSQMVVQKQAQDLGGWDAQKTKGPEYTCERGAWAWEGCGFVWYSAAVRYTTDIWSCKNRHET